MRVSVPIHIIFSGLVLCLLAVGAMAGMGYAVGLVGNPFDTNPFDDLAFNQKIWTEDASCSDRGNRRGHMAEDLLRHRLRTGMTLAQVQSLLGEPEKILHKSEASQLPLRYRIEDAQAALILTYYVGEDFLPHNYCTWLDLFFDKQGHYVSGRISSPPDDWRVVLPN